MIELGAEELNSITPSFQGSILKSVMKQLIIDSNVEIPKGTEINYKFGLKIDENYEYLNYGNYIVENCTKKEDTLSYEVICYDKMLFSMKDYEDIGINYPITIKDYISKISQHLGLAFFDENKIFTNYNKQIPNELYLDQDGNNLGYTIRDVLDEIAQVTASTICINESDQLEIRYINETNETINEEFLKDVNVNFGEKYGPINSIVLSRSGESDNVFLKDDVSIKQNGLTEIKIVDNQIMNDNNRADYLPEIYNVLNGFEYYINDFSSTGIGYLELCDKYNVEIYGNTYPCVLFNDELLVTQGLQENIYTEIPEETETDYKVSDSDDRKINQAYIIVNKQNQTIEAVVSQVGEQNEKVAKVTQTVEELNSKIGDLADITTSQESNNGKLEFENINQSEPIRIVIRPNNESISYLYPSSGLYPTNEYAPATQGLVPSATLKPSNSLIPRTSRPAQDVLYPKTRTLRFHNKTTGEDFDLVLPDDVLYHNSQNYDEFILDYDGLSCVINKKVGWNADGTTYVLDNPTTKEYEYPHLEITDGDYEITLLGYDNVYMFIRLMAQNIYTTQFATKAELNSEITQTSQAINLSVDKKLSNYSTTTEMNAQIQITADGINQSVSQKVGKNEVVSSINNAIKDGQGVIELKSNSVVIESDNFSLNKDGTINAKNGSFKGTINATNGSFNGIITSTEGNVGGWNLDSTGLSNGNYYIRKNGYSNIYAMADIFMVQMMILGTLPTPASGTPLFRHYDLNNDGVIDIKDMLAIQRMILEEN
jgi:hypothetical protein